MSGNGNLLQELERSLWKVEKKKEMEIWELYTSSRAMQGCVSFNIVFFWCITLTRSLFFNIKTKREIVIGFQHF